MSKQTPRAIPLVVVGAAGRMGRLIASAAAHDSRFALVGAIDVPSHAGDVLPELPNGPRVSGTLDAATRPPRVVVEFAQPGASAEVARWCASHGAALVVGTTGHEDAMTAVWDEAAARVPVLLAPNTSVGVTALLAHLPALARSLADFDAHVVEAHHRLKKDAPSGTGLALVRALDRAPTDVPTSSIRAGTIPGVHTVHLAGSHERIEITHVAESRACFVDGALRAAAWLAAQRPGLYTMRDVLDTSKETA